MLIKFNRLLLLAFAFISTSSIAQENLSHFTPFRTQGEIPNAIFIPTQTKIAEAQKEANKIPYKSVDQKTNVSSFLFDSNYEIDYLLRSGKILFNSNITNYLESIMDLVLAQETNLRSRIHIYLLKSTEVNAYATQQGYIFVSVGLLAQLENEAQLAFILAHEAQHLAGDHSIQFVLANSRRGSTGYEDKSTSYSRKMTKLEYSRKQETEADTAGFRRAIQSGYKAESAISAMDILQLSFIPFTNVRFNFSEIETPDFKIPNWAIADTVKEIPLNTDEDDDSYSSHPNIVSRRKALMDLELSKADGKKFLVSKAKFDETVSESRFELVFLHLVEGDYASSLYISNALLQKYPNNQFLEEAFAKSLYGVYAYRANNKKSNVNFNSNKHYGEMERMSVYFNDMETTELGLVTFRKLYDVEQKYHNPFITHVLDDFIGMFTTKSKKDFNYFIKKKNYSAELINKGMNIKHDELVERIKNNTKSTLTEEAPKTSKLGTQISEKVEGSEESETESKYEKLRTQRGEKKVKSEKEYTEESAEEAPDWLEHYIYMTLANVNEQELEARFDSVFKIYATNEEDQSNWEKQYAAQVKKYERHGFEMGLDSLLIVDPYFIDVVVRSKKTQLKNVDENQMKFAQSFQSIFDDKLVNGKLLAWQTMNPSDSSRYNDMAEMNDWFEEIKRHVNNDISMIALTTDYFKPVLDNYHCKYVVFPGAIRIHDKTITHAMQAASFILPSVFAPPIALAGIGMTISAHYGTEYFYYVYNLEDGTLVWHHQNTIDGKLSMSSTEIYFQDLIRQTISK